MILMRKRYILGGWAGLQKQHSMAGQCKNDNLSLRLISQTIWPGIWPDSELQDSNAGSDTYTGRTIFVQGTRITDDSPETTDSSSDQSRALL